MEFFRRVRQKPVYLGLTVLIAVLLLSGLGLAGRHYLAGRKDDELAAEAAGGPLVAAGEVESASALAADGEEKRAEE